MKRETGDEADRLPPYSTEAEQGVLGCVLLDAQASMDVCHERRVHAGMFYELRHQGLWELLEGMLEKGQAVDGVTVAAAAGKECLESLGGLSYVAGLPDVVPSAANLTHYIEILKEHWQRRRLLQIAGAAMDGARSGDLADVLSRTESDLMGLSEVRAGAAEVGIKVLLQRTINSIENYHRGHGQLLGLSSGFEYLDKMTSGLVAPDLVVVAARPSVGKTSFALQLADQVSALNGNAGMLIFSLEMSALQLGERLVFGNAGIDYQRFRTGFMENADVPKLTDAMSRLSKTGLVVDDTADLDIQELRARTRRIQRKHGIKVVVIDYLQLIRGAKRYANREAEVADISRQLKVMAKELQLVVVVLAQLNRSLEKERNRAPMLSDLRESGAIEQDADQVWFLWSPNNKGQEEDSDWSRNNKWVTLSVAKQRNGPTGIDRMVFKKWCMRFEEVKDYEHDDGGKKEVDREMPTNADLGL